MHGAPAFGQGFGRMCMVLGRLGLWRHLSFWSILVLRSPSSAFSSGPPYLKIGRQVRYRQALVQRWLEGEIQGGSPTDSL